MSATPTAVFPATEIESYNEKVVTKFLIAAMFWGAAGMLVGILIALQLAWPALNLPEWFTFGRLRPLHTSGVILGLGGNLLFGASFYIVQRTCRAGLFGGPLLADILFWGFQTLMVIAGTGYLMGITQGKEYAEPEWYADLMLTVLWVIYLIIYAGTVFMRKEKHIYVSNWFFLAFILTVAVLHISNNISLPVSFTGTKSYNINAGATDALVQWWYGHNMVGFFLTAAFIGVMYYIVPKQAERPIYSYRLSIVHFWALIFLYIWAGPHHLLYTSLPDWAQTLGMVFSIMLWMPSWGGMVNGIMTLSGAWGKLRTDPILRMLVVAIAFYGMSTFEGPLMSIKEVNRLSHYTDWTIGHVHSGALGWVGFLSFGAMYFLMPRLLKRPLWSLRLVEWHFWIATLGIIVYITAMWISGITQGLMWRAYDAQGFLSYSFADTVAMLHPYYVIRALGGVLYLGGMLLMVWNFIQTARQPGSAAAPAPQPALA